MSNSLEDAVIRLYEDITELSYADLEDWNEEDAYLDYNRNYSFVAPGYESSIYRFIDAVEQLILSRYTEALISPTVYLRKYAELLKDKYLSQRVD